MAKKKAKKRQWSAKAKREFAERMKKAREKTGTVAKKLKGVFVMAKKKRSGSGSSVPMVGKKRHHRGGGGKYPRHSMGQIVKEAATGIIGGVAAGMVANRLPIKQPLVKAAVPIVAGAALIATVAKKNPYATYAALGMVMLGGLALIRAQFPQMALLAGDEDLSYAPAQIEDASQYGTYGAEEISGPVEITETGFGIGDEEFVTAADVA